MQTPSAPPSGQSIFLLLVIVAIALYFILPWANALERRLKEAAALKVAEQKRGEAIAEARHRSEILAEGAAIFAVTMDSTLPGYHLKELGWVNTETEDRSVAERELKLRAAREHSDPNQWGNALSKLSFSFVDREVQDGERSDGSPRLRMKKFKKWEAMACHAIPMAEVDTSTRRWNERTAVVDGSNVAFWGKDDSCDLGCVKLVIDLLQAESIRPLVVFDANIGFKAEGRHLSVSELCKILGKEVSIEIVSSGTVADRRIVELAETERCMIVSNDTFRDSIRARPIPKRRGFILPEYAYAELLPPRP